MDSDAYDRLYAFHEGTDDLITGGTNDREIRIRPGLSAEEVYRKLPSASDLEYAGYLTKTRIRYAEYWATMSSGPNSKACTFHSHPTGLNLGDPDVPSTLDVYGFLKWRHLRAITVGRDLIWVMDKTRRTVRSVRKLADWEAEHMLPELKRLFSEQGERGKEAYLESVLRSLGLKLPTSPRAFKSRWPELLRDRLHIKVTLFRR